MSLQINSAQYVDEKYSSLLEPLFYSARVLIDGVVFTSKYETDKAGQILVHKLAKGTVVVATPGTTDFSTSENADTLVTLPLNYAFQQDRKIRDIVKSLVSYDKVAAELETAMSAISEKWQDYGVAMLVNGATPLYSTGTTKDTTALTTSNVIEYLTKLRKKIRDNKYNLNYFIVDTSTYALLLQVDDFAKEKDPQILRTGVVGYILGAPVLEANNLSQTVTLLDTTAVDLSKVSVIAGMTDAFSIVDFAATARVVDAENFVGSRVQVETNHGYKVTNADAVFVKYNA